MLLVCITSVYAPLAGAQKNQKKAETDTTKMAPVLEFSRGLFAVSQQDKDWYFEIPDSLLGRRILAVTRYVTNTPGASEYGGEEINESMVYWEKAINGNLLLRADVLTIKSDEDQAISKAVEVSSENPIIASFKPEKDASAGNTRVKVSSLFEDDTQIFSFTPGGKRSMGLGSLKKDATFISSIRTYPINTEVTVTKTYSYSSQSGNGSSSYLPAGAQTGLVTLQMNTSFVLLPETPMQPRMFDPRVGFFADSYTEFSDDQQSVEDLRFITRYRLEAKPEDVEKEGRTGRTCEAYHILYRSCNAKAVGTLSHCRSQ